MGRSFAYDLKYYNYYLSFFNGIEYNKENRDQWKKEFKFFNKLKTKTLEFAYIGIRDRPYQACKSLSRLLNNGGHRINQEMNICISNKSQELKSLGTTLSSLKFKSIFSQGFTVKIHFQYCTFTRKQFQDLFKHARNSQVIGFSNCNFR
ncbi:unnamed protein product [Moneuplotes crassus]|uniref:Uncharacterized protein n=1 Tax=Euplotes crassus TaxID=5936 RepID=A0AAD1XQ47_EUPCR|nr:unnamed protein product [Moneuplotes crassus]